MGVWWVDGFLYIILLWAKLILLFAKTSSSIFPWLGDSLLLLGKSLSESTWQMSRKVSTSGWPLPKWGQPKWNLRLMRWPVDRLWFWKSSQHLDILRHQHWKVPLWTRRFVPFRVWWFASSVAYCCSILPLAMERRWVMDGGPMLWIVPKCWLPPGTMIAYQLPSNGNTLCALLPSNSRLCSPMPYRQVAVNAPLTRF